MPKMKLDVWKIVQCFQGTQQKKNVQLLLVLLTFVNFSSLHAFQALIQ